MITTRQQSICTNSFYRQSHDGVLLRVLLVLPDEDVAIVKVTNDTSVLPKQLRLSELNDALNTRRLLPVEYTEQASSKINGDAAKAAFAKLKPAIDELLAPGLLTLSQRALWPELRRVGEKHKIKPSTLSKMLGRVINAGLVVEAAIPLWRNCGRKPVSTDDLRPTAQPGAYSLSVNDLANIKDGVLKFYKDGATWKNAYNKFLERYYPAKVVINLGHEIIQPLPVGQRPSLKQFKWHGKRLVKVETLLRNNLGDRIVETEHRGKPLGQSEGGLYPGHVGEIDWTKTDVVFVARGSRLSVGRFVIYVVVDVFSGMILSIYLTVGEAKYYEASRAILRCLEDKGELFARYGSCFTGDHWPVSCLPPEIRSDKGEIDSWKAQGLIKFSGVQIEYCASKRPDQKGTCESFFAVARWLLRRLRGGTSGMKERLKDHPNVTSIYDFDQVYRVLLNLVVKFNARIRRRQALRPGMLADGVIPVPNKIWQWAQERGCIRPYSIENARIETLPGLEANVTAEGIRIRGLHYLVPNATGIDANDWLINARVKAFPEHFAIDPATVNFVYLLRKLPDGKTEALVCNLGPEDKGWLDFSWQEYETKKKQRRADITEYLEGEQRLIFATAEADNRKLTAHAAAATKAAREGMSMAEQIRGTEPRRADEIAKISGNAARSFRSEHIRSEDEFLDDDWADAKGAS